MSNPLSGWTVVERVFALMKASVWIINVARGALIDKHVLIDAQEWGKVGAAFTRNAITGTEEIQHESISLTRISSACI
ncbi:MAG: NAD(P)-dependent oxidoreductase [Candidatus Vecturithrix sp.]|jgi:hypothetical protein|nr:NAD(P)-dependent oxidoreductase [Candidatus Vecturithrix sp.]